MPQVLIGRTLFVLGLALVVPVLPMPALADSVSPLDISPSTEGEGDGTLAVEVKSDGAASAQAGQPSSNTGQSKFSFHGFMTQAYADASFTESPIIPLPNGTFGPAASPNGLEVAIGIPEDGTFDYRFLALQFRYDISEKDVFTVQLSSRELGFSPTTDTEDEVELDWAFYERKLSDNTSLKVGRIQIPMGIFNETRDVGVLLPFYRPAFNFYREGTFTSETVDGLLVQHEFFPDSDWGLQVSAYVGEWDLVFLDPAVPDLATLEKAESGYGYQIWLALPASDIRIGTGLNSYKTDVLFGERTDIYFASFEGVFSRFTLRAEAQAAELVFPGPFGSQLNVDVASWYAQAGYAVTDQFSIWVQREEDTVDAGCVCFLTDPPKRDNFPDWGVALNYAFTPSLVLKGEYHQTEATAAASTIDFSTGVPLLVNSFYPYGKGSYTILSLSVSF